MTSKWIFLICRLCGLKCIPANTIWKMNSGGAIDRALCETYILLVG